MKKLFSIFLIVLLSSFLASCGEKDNGNQNKMNKSEPLSVQVGKDQPRY